MCRHDCGVALYPPPEVGGFTATTDKFKKGNLVLESMYNDYLLNKGLAVRLFNDYLMAKYAKAIANNTKDKS